MPKSRTSTLLVGISGGSCSGKTTLVQALMDRMGSRQITIIEHDRYYRDQAHVPLAERAKVNYDNPDALETTLLIEHLTSLRNGNTVKIPVYDFARHTRSQTTTKLFPTEIIVIEGILIHAVPALRKIIDLIIYVHTEADIRLARRINRDVAERGRTVRSVLQQYFTTARPGHVKFVEPTRVFAELVISGTDDHHLQASKIIAKIHELLPSP